MQVFNDLLVALGLLATAQLEIKAWRRIIIFLCMPAPNSNNIFFQIPSRIRNSVPSIMPKSGSQQARITPGLV